MISKPVRVLPSYRPKIWGHTALEPWFRTPDEKIGEVWFTFDENQTDCGHTLIELIRNGGPEVRGTRLSCEQFPILVKFIFTSDRLSVQVHPDDEHARSWEGSPGKTEMWHVLRAEPGAGIALGFQDSITRERLREAAISGEIEQLIRWFPVKPGDTFFTPTGTVHAIGAGVSLIEIQQNSDITYRLYDYGRPRELHLDKAVAIANLDPHPGPCQPVPLAGGAKLLAHCRHFATERLSIPGDCDYEADCERFHIIIVLEGSGCFGEARFGPGEVWLVPACAGRFRVKIEKPAEFIRTYVPEAEAAASFRI